ncbi:MAG: PAS-domain containing protein [Hyphomicrobiales bacterium]|nr:PAS-domain containing protein [Hyphomicrobiales bacterium]
MIAGWAAVLTTLAYTGLLFAIAMFGDTRGRALTRGPLRSAVYAMALGVYCTSWTFYGSVGLASASAWQFLPIYVGPLLVYLFGGRLLRRIVLLSRSQSITSVADFVAARYGKAESVATVATLLCVVAAIPYIALQLKAIIGSLELVLGSLDANEVIAAGDYALPSGVFVPVALATFAMMFGTRRVDATETQDGLMLAIAVESVVKLAAFLAVGAFVTFGVFGGFSDLLAQGLRNAATTRVLAAPVDWTNAITMTMLSAVAIVLLPRQFHVTFVENRDPRDIGVASWVFPSYLIAINIFVVPLALAGLLLFPQAGLDRDMTVLALPLARHHNLLAIFVMLGGISAGTAMVVVESVALSIMLTNDLVLPLVLRRDGGPAPAAPGGIGSRILITRRIAIAAVVALAYLYVRMAPRDAGLAAIGLLSFSGIAQIAPAFFGGLFWRGASREGALAGMVVGALVWAYTLLLTSLNPSWPPLANVLSHGPFAIAWLKPTQLFGLDLQTLPHGVFWSLGFNILAYVAVSLWRKPEGVENIQADSFSPHPGLDADAPGAFRLWRSSVTAGELEATVARYLGSERTRIAFDSFFVTRGAERRRAQAADAHLMRFAERLLASAIGAASSRLVLSLALSRRNLSHKTALKLVDEASAAIQYNRDLLQYAIDFARQGITVVDREQRLICWNREFRQLFDLPEEFLQVGVSVEEIVRFNAQRGLYGSESVEHYVATRVPSLINERRPSRVFLDASGRTIEVRSAGMPDGGVVTTYTDVTQQVEAEKALEATNETLEQRVRDRTNELELLNAELADAKASAEDANLSKTRFLAAASHDILQPLNAARLYTTALAERARSHTLEPEDTRRLADNVDASLEAVEEILTALLDISRLDAGAMKAELGAIRLADIFAQLRIEFEPLAKAKNLELRFTATQVWIRSDRRLLRRLLQNFVSNAIKYTQSGKVLIGVRRRGPGRARIEVWDTGVGIATDQQSAIFREFARLDAGQRAAPGLGLGLSIVERLARVLEADMGLRSRSGSGSVFWVDAPVTAPARVMASEEEGPPALGRPLAGMIVCAIDNEPAILEGMRTLLGGWGCRVFTGANAPLAAQALESAQCAPHAIVADYHLDGGDGLGAIAELRARYGESTPAVLLTADRTDDLRNVASEQDVRVLSKPLRPAALRSLLAQWRVTQRAAE